MDDRFRELKRHISSMGGVVVCFSGGLDSTALVHICREALGDSVVALHVSVPMESGRTVAMVDGISAHLGFDVTKRYMDDRISGIVLQNRWDRCYWCKKAIYSEAIDLAHELGFEHVLCGDNADDDPGSRPGMRAAEELMIDSPFRDLGIGRKEIESYIGRLNLPFPMVKDTCLLTRIPIDTEADDVLLERIERVESGIRSIAGVEQVRGRILDGVVRVQTSEREVPKLLSHSREIEELCEKEGFGTELVRTGYDG